MYKNKKIIWSNDYVYMVLSAMVIIYKDHGYIMQQVPIRTEKLGRLHLCDRESEHTMYQGGLLH